MTTKLKPLSFAAVEAPPPPPAPPKVRLGRFGRPDGIRLQPAHPVPAPVLGDFGRAQDPPQPADPPPAAKLGLAGFNGTATAPAAFPASARVHAAGFGDSGESAHASSPAGAVHLGSFAVRSLAPPAEAPGAKSTAASVGTVQPPEVLSWPRPAYTALALEHHIEGDVILKVRLRADGTVEILGVEQGLGDGLDHSAEIAAKQLHFHPARARGRAVDWTGLLHIQFRLAY
ncbi:MAG: energy transducer TonB [Terriglobales bacterium]